MSFRDLKWHERLLPYFWISVMVLIVVTGFVISRFLRSTAQPPDQNATETVGQAAGTQATTPTAGGLSAATLTPAQADLPITSPTIPPTVMVDYTVQQGETLAGIAAFFKTDVFTLMALNPSVTPEFLKPGDTIVIPSQEVVPSATPEPGAEKTVIEYQVVAGDTLAGIAARYSVSVDALVAENNLTSPNEIREGQVIRIRVQVTLTPTPEAQAPATPSP